MPVKPKKTTKARTAKKAKPATKATVKKARKAKKPPAKKKAKKPVAKKAVAKTSPAKKTAKQQGKPAPAKKSTKKATNKRTAKTPAEKTAWKISPEISQSVYKIDTWKKGDIKIEHLRVYRTGWIVVDQLPDLSGYNPDEGVSIFEEFQFEEHQVLDGSEETSIFPNELPAEERQRLLALSEEELEEEGWTIESATRFSGPLVVEEV